MSSCIYHVSAPLIGRVRQLSPANSTSCGDRKDACPPGPVVVRLIVSSRWTDGRADYLSSAWTQLLSGRPPVSQLVFTRRNAMMNRRTAAHQAMRHPSL